MAKLGSFTRSESGEFVGTIATLTFSAALKFTPVLGPLVEAAPCFRIYAETVEVGAAWAKTRSSGAIYYSVKIDDPSFSSPIYATLIEADDHGVYSLIWNRPGSARHRAAA